MIQINQLKLPVEHKGTDIKNKIIKELELGHIFKDMPNFDYRIIRRSIDARKKPIIFYIYSVSVDFGNDKTETILLKKCKSKNVSIYNPPTYIPRDVKSLAIEGLLEKIIPPIIIGEGPCGLFAGLILAKAGLKPIIFERGDEISIRLEKVLNFWDSHELDAESNVQFGEGGAGTFSDGKLNTLVKDKTGKNQFVLDTFVQFGADAKCAYDSKPHIGTDVLQEVIVNIRNEIIRLGGQVHHLCRLDDITVMNGSVKALSINNNSGKEIVLNDLNGKKLQTLSIGSNVVNASDVILAIGHSARDTFEILERRLEIEQKNFAVGIRIQHPQKMINNSQYGKGHSEALPPSPYKVTNKTSNGRDVFSFCMCPGGYVVNASSKANRLCVNGMSYSDRGSENANSALIVAIDRKDFADDSPLSGMYLQEKLEENAYKLGNGKIPVQLFKDYKAGVASKQFGDINPVFKGETSFANLRDVFPEEINKAIIESIEKFGYTIEGFSDGDAILAAVESRTSSPIRITRDETLQSSVRGLYPAGEGAGYAGGIMSAAMDGIRVADAIINKYSEVLA